MSRTVRRKNEGWLKLQYQVGYRDFSFSCSTLYYAHWLIEETIPDWYYLHLSQRYRCSVEQVKAKCIARFHGDTGKGKWCGKVFYVKDYERSYRRQANQLASMSIRFLDTDDHDYTLSQKSRKIHPFFYS